MINTSVWANNGRYTPGVTVTGQGLEGIFISLLTAVRGGALWEGLGGENRHTIGEETNH